ncbi:MAG TPA: hypothetical protein DEZ08_03685 [Dehalococcoidia bacterium]|jgi:hypothetical protein|nr:hypothetical protein [Dehalococcoidia bacterium]|tara:strand:- start:173 stop:586 length:414 start_codon:yes stop_codon:yes gene_type:complete
MRNIDHEPLYSDRHRVSVNLSLIFALLVIFYGLIQEFRGNADGAMLVIVGSLVAVYTWLTKPRTFEVYENCLVLRYGRPRRRVIPFENIDRVDQLKLAVPDRWRVYLKHGRRVVLLTKNPETLVEHLNKAIEAYENR